MENQNDLIKLNSINLKIQKLKGIIPDNVISQILQVVEKYNIVSPLRLSHFLSQCSHESSKFKVVNENLNYSVEGLLKIFKSDFDTNKDRVLSETEKKVAELLARKPQKIANFVYANQNGNGGVNSGDGWKYRGRGYIQLTGKYNYEEFDKTVEDDIISNPDLVATKYPLESAIFFFNKNNLWSICDRGANIETIIALTKKINGGTIGLDDRIEQFNKFYKILA